MRHVVTVRPCRIGSREVPAGLEFRLDEEIAVQLIAAGDAVAAPGSEPPTQEGDEA